MQIITLIPASGKGSRFGSPKVDALYNGVSFLQMILNTLRDAGLLNCYVLRDLETPDMLATVRYGMQRALRDASLPDGWLIWPVDHPLVKPATVLALLKDFAEKRNSVLIPRHQGRNGHPIILPGSFTIPQTDNPDGLKGVISQAHYPIGYVEVDDAGILVNINTPEDILYV